uniref:Phosphatidylinositol transfer protein N-terminal domain-containing protein n=1 Tax=Onchocerca volvulus TaxID=6282 RepID=A0A8R1XQB2_ONCVO
MSIIKILLPTDLCPFRLNEQLEFSVIEDQSVIHGVTADDVICSVHGLLLPFWGHFQSVFITLWDRIRWKHKDVLNVMQLSLLFSKEFRILMPLEVDEYYRGQLFAVSETSRNETGGGDGVLILENDDFTSTTVRPGHSITGIYTHKIYYTKSKSPWALRKIFPDAAFVLHEECWNAFPYCKTVIKNPDYMKDAFYINIESMHLPDKGHTENALDLSPALLKKREVIVIDIYDDSLLKKTDITPETDVREFKSKKTGREKLSKDWIETTKPVMCCYKVVRVHFKMFGFQTMVEHILQRQYPRIFAKFNRELYCWTDRWYDMTIEDIKKMEREMVEELKKKIAEPERRGIVCDVGDKSA